jgi:hypothetical protein
MIKKRHRTLPAWSGVVVVAWAGLAFVNAAPQNGTASQVARAASYRGVLAAAKAHGRKSLADDPTTREINSESRLVIQPGGPTDAIDQLGTSACQSDAVVIGELTTDSSYLSGDNEFVFTDYHLRVAKVLRGSDIVPGDTLTYVRPGGRVKVKGRPVIATHSDYPELTEDTRYLLFLKKLDNGSYKATDDTGWTLNAVEIRGDRASGVGPQAIRALRNGIAPITVEQAITSRQCSR